MKVETIQPSILEKARTNCRCMMVSGPTMLLEAWSSLGSWWFPVGAGRLVPLWEQFSHVSSRSGLPGKSLAFSSVTGSWVLIVQFTSQTISDGS